MKFTASWLFEHLECPKDISKIADTLNNLGLEVESVERNDLLYDGLLVAEIVSAEKHPNADRLQVCKVDIGQKEIVELICGAPNAEKGLKAIFAPVGYTVPQSNITLKKTKIRGIDSNGMLLSGFELGLNNEKDGIIALPDDAKIGTSYSEWSGDFDTVFDVSPTPNRPDWLGVRGIARDLMAVGYGTLKPLPYKDFSNEPIIDDNFSFNIKNDNNACINLCARAITDINNISTPDWLKKRLLAIGQRSISILIDISNYLMFDLGRPLHFYDIDKLPSKSLKMATLLTKTEFETLKGETKLLPKGTTVVLSGESIEGIGGIMGGQASSCSNSTKSIIIESAHFEPANIFRTGKKLGLKSEAGFRIERGLDPLSTKIAVDCATSLILELCGGKIGKLITSGNFSYSNDKIVLTKKKLDVYAGQNIDISEATDILQKIGCTVAQKTNSSNEIIIEAVAPSWRNDIKYDVCLIEEIFRLRGLDKIDDHALPFIEHIPDNSLSFRRQGMARRLLASIGYFESLSLAFAKINNKTKQVIVSNPINKEQGALRNSLIPNLLQQIINNFTHSNYSFSLFENGPIFLIENNNIIQKQYITAIKTGHINSLHWSKKPESVNPYKMKDDCLKALSCLGIKIEVLREKPINRHSDKINWYHPGKSLSLYLGNNEIARLGMISPIIANEYGLNVECGIFEIMVDAIKFPRNKSKHSRPVFSKSKYPVVERDLAFIFLNNIKIGEVVNSIKRVSKELILDVFTIDVYQNINIGSTNKSVAFRIKIQNKLQTLTESNIKCIINNIVEMIKNDYSAILRE